MRLIFFRHGKAQKKKKANTESEDFRRRLTNEGTVETKEIVRMCPFLLKKLDAIYTSPLSRAVQTAQILYRHYKPAKFEILSSLDPLCDLSEFQRDLKFLSKSGSYCFVGHEPHLSESIHLLMQGRGEAKIELAKSGLVVLEGEDLFSLKLTALVSPKLMI